MATSIADIQAQLKGKAAVSKPKLDLTSSEDIPFWAGIRVMTIAAFGEGKTHFLLTGSKHYPKQWPAAEKTVLDDIVVLETDSSGLAMLSEGNVAVPRVLNFTGLTHAEMYKVFMDIPEFLAEEVRRAPTRLVGIDTATVLWQAVNNTIQKRASGPMGYNELAIDLAEWMSKLKKVSVPVVFTGHIKPPKVIMDAKGEFIKADSDVASGLKGRLGFNLEGNKGANCIREAMTLTGRLVCEKRPGGAAERVINFDDPRTEGKRRLSISVDPTEPADLGALVTKIAERCNQPLPEDQ
jgi:hypothetical protein